MLDSKKTRKNCGESPVVEHIQKYDCDDTSSGIDCSANGMCKKHNGSKSTTLSAVSEGCVMMS